MRSWPHCALLFAAAVACGDNKGPAADGGRSCETDGCNDPDPEDFACQDVVDRSGRDPDPAFLEGLKDPFAVGVLKRPGECPRSLSEMVAKLRLEDDDRCEDDPRTGMLGRVVSERAQLLEEPDNMRAVVSRQCGQRLAYELLFTVPGIDAANPELPEGGTQVIAFDRRSGAFNFYALEGTGTQAQWAFHGNSFDQIDPALRETSTCASCHADGGLAMREIDSPWVHWESSTVRTVGAGIVIDRFSELGARSTGAELSTVVQSGNAHWNRTRITALSDPDRTELHQGSTRRLLEPLFCGTTFNLQSAGLPSELGNPRPVRAVPGSFFVDPMLAAEVTVPIDDDHYVAALEAIGSRVEGVIGPRDTFLGLTFVERAASDVSYVQALITFGLVDEEFVLDVLSVDFTTPVYSVSRCALLDHAPSFADLEGTTDPPDLPEERSCCVPHQSPGCENLEVLACVCDDDDYCCTESWDQSCVNAAIDGGCGTCSGITPVRGVSATPGSSAASPTGNRLRNAFYAALDGVEGPAAEAFREALATRDQVAAHRDRAARFLQACADRSTARDPEGFVRDVLDVAAWKRREAAAATPLLDTPGAVATDDLDPPLDLQLDPVTCAPAQR